MNYLDKGYDTFLTRDPYPSTNQEVDPLQEDLNTPQLSASKVQGGVMQTTDGRTQLNLEQGFFGVNDGAVEVVRLGVQEDSSIGILIKDRNGVELLRFTGDVNLMQSPNQHFQADFNNERIDSKDEGGTIRARFGKLD